MQFYDVAYVWFMPNFGGRLLNFPNMLAISRGRGTSVVLVPLELHEKEWPECQFW